jgi:hypothetical protein
MAILSRHPKELDSLQVSADDPFADPFFDAFEKELRSGSFAVEPVLGDIQRVSIIEEPGVDESSKYSSKESKPLAPETVVGDVKYSFDIPDPEIELLSSDDEAENDDPATGLEIASGVAATKVETPESPTKPIHVFDSTQNKTPEYDDAPVDEIMEMERQATISVSALSISAKVNTSGKKPLHRSKKVVAQRKPSEKFHKDETATMIPPHVENEPSTTNVLGNQTSQPGQSLSLGSVMHLTVPVASTEDNSQTPAASNLSYKIRMKRYEKENATSKAVGGGRSAIACSKIQCFGTRFNVSLFESFQGKGFK